MLIGATGLSGAGKTTSIEYLAERLPGTQVYVGQEVTNEIARRHLEATPEVERRIRAEIRDQEGEDAFARRALPRIRQLVNAGAALIDAIYVRAEWELYCGEFAERAFLFKVETSLPVRKDRVSNRKHRPLTPEELDARDEFELNRLKLKAVFEIADAVVPNDAGLPELRIKLDELINRLRE